MDVLPEWRRAVLSEIAKFFGRTRGSEFLRSLAVSFPFREQAHFWTTKVFREEHLAVFFN